MNEQEIKLPELPTLGGLEIAITFGPEYIGKLMQSYAREAVRMNLLAEIETIKSGDGESGHHFKTLGYTGAEKTVLIAWGSDAETAYGALKGQISQNSHPITERRPFDLESAKRGEPLVTRDGRPARFVAHVPEAGEMYRVLALIEEHAIPTFYNESGAYYGDSWHPSDLFMAPKPKRTVWANTYYHDTKESALMRGDGADLVAVPLEIDA